MAKRKTVEEKYKNNLRKQTVILEEFAAHETDWANDLMLWYRVKKMDMPDNEYRGCSFFLNKEYLKKPGSLTLLYQMYLAIDDDEPEKSKENAVDWMRYRYDAYAKVLKAGGF
jgi:hypothetical protein